MDINRIRSAANAGAEAAASAAGVREPAALQFASSMPPRDLVSALANLRAHAAAATSRPAHNERLRAGTGGRPTRPSDIKQAVTSAKGFLEFVNQGGSDDPADWPSVRPRACRAFIEAHDALDALKALDLRQRRTFERSGDAVTLLMALAKAAAIAIFTYRNEFNDVRDALVGLEARVGGGDMQSRGQSLAIERAHHANIPRLTSMLDEAMPFRQRLHELVAPYCGADTPHDAEKVLGVLAFASLGIAGAHEFALEVEKHRLRAHLVQLERIAGYDGDPDAKAKMDALLGVFGPEPVADLGRIVDRCAHPAATVSPHDMQWLAAYIDKLDGHADAFCVRASNETGGDHPELEAVLLGIASAVGSMIGTLEQIRSQPKLPAEIADRFCDTTVDGQPLRRPEDRPADPPAAPTAGAQNAAAPVDDWAVKIHTPRSEPQRSRRTGKGRARATGSTRAQPEPAGASHAPAASAALRERSATPEAINAAQTRLRAFAAPAPLPEASASAFVALGRQLNKDTGALELMTDPACNPLALGHMMRTSIESWFGNRAQWQRAKDALGAPPDGTDGAHAQVHHALTQRIAGIDALLDQVGRLELDLTKRYMFPKAVHVDKLLKAGAIASVSSLRVLPPFDAADPSKGTTFEAEIRLRPTSDGNAAASLYLHLHTATPVDAQTCRALGFDQLEAKHVKTADQSRLGRTWETFQRTVLGTDERVHRGPMTRDVLAELMLRMEPS